MDKNAIKDAHAEPVSMVLEIIENIARISGKIPDKTPKSQHEIKSKSREYIINLLEKIELNPNYDSDGNIFARLEGKDIDLPPVTLVSRLNLASSEGKYSKSLGVAGSLAAVSHIMKNLPILSHSVEIAVLSNVRPQIPKGKPKAFLELNVARGDTLFKEDASLGIVDKITAAAKLKITVEGTTARLYAPLASKRQDALVSAAMIILLVRDIAAQKENVGVISTVEDLKILSGGLGFVPAKVEIRIDIRSTTQNSIIETLQELKDEISIITEEQNTTVSIAVLSSQKPLRLDGSIAKMIEAACQKYNFVSQHLDSPAEYASMNMSNIAKGALLLIPCSKNSGNPLEEDVKIKDIEAGIKVLTEVLYQLAK